MPITCRPVPAGAAAAEKPRLKRGSGVSRAADGGALSVADLLLLLVGHRVGVHVRIVDSILFGFPTCANCVRLSFQSILLSAEIMSAAPWS